MEDSNYVELVNNIRNEVSGNDVCADCKKQDPRWASFNLGIFICLRCSGIHRSLGTHISKVKSLDLDTWTYEQYKYMQDIGNVKANKYWEAKLDDNFEPPESNLEYWIRQKYEEGSFKGDFELPKVDLSIKKKDNTKNEKSNSKEKNYTLEQAKLLTKNIFDHSKKQTTELNSQHPAYKLKGANMFSL